MDPLQARQRNQINNSRMSEHEKYVTAYGVTTHIEKKAKTLSLLYNINIHVLCVCGSWI